MASSITEVVNVTIIRETSFIREADLNTIAIISNNPTFTNTHRIYTNLDQVIDDGFDTDTFIYKAISTAFAQDIRPKKVVVTGGEVATGEYVQKISDTRAAFNQFLFVITDASADTDIEAIAAYVEAQELFYAFTVEDVVEKGDLIAKLKTLGYVRTMVLFNENTNDTIPEAGWVGRFGSEQAGSNTWVLKPVKGVLPSTLTEAQKQLLQDNNVSWLDSYEDDAVVSARAGKVSGGEWIDVMLGVQWITTRMREAVYNVLRNNRKVGMSNEGLAKIEAPIRQVIERAISMGILAASPQYTLVMPDILAMTPQERNSRKVTGITFRARLEGAIHFVDIEGTVYP